MKTRLFTPDILVHYVRRRNRFVLECLGLDGKEPIAAHVGNPGRMWELLEPGSILALERLEPGGKMQWRVGAVAYGEAWVPLMSARANLAASRLVLPVLYPDAVLKAEVRAGAHRLDFRADFDSREAKTPPIYIEVKSCSLIEENTAMFPDAPSERAGKHLETLVAVSRPEQLTGAEQKNMVLWVIMHGSPRRFIPNLHTDPDLALKIREFRPLVDFRAALIHCDAEGWAELVDDDIPVDLGPLDNLERDRGSYLLGLFLGKERTVTYGNRTQVLGPGWYVYVGSAMGGIKARIGHHRRRFLAARAGKACGPGHWHIDQLTEAASEFLAYPIRSELLLEDRLASALGAMPASREIPGFGSSDRPGRSHLFTLPCRPHEYKPFREILFSARHDWFYSGEYTTL